MTCPHCSDFHGNIFPKIKEHIKSNYLNTKTVKENYKYNNNFYDLLENNTQIISI